VFPSVLSMALLLSAPGPTGLQKGDEFTFSGSIKENEERPRKGLQRELHREYELCLRLFVLDRQELWADAALLTQLRRIEDAVGAAAKPVTGTVPYQNAPPIVRLDLVRIHTDGNVRLLWPAGPPFRLAEDTPVMGLPSIPLDKCAPSEFGIFPPHLPASTAPGETWTVAAGSNRPDEMWIALKKMEYINAEQCRKLVMNQHSPDWMKPMGSEPDWHRADAVWVSTQDGTARKVHRVIRQWDGPSKLRGVEVPPAAWIEVQYELKDHEKLSGRTYERTRRDVEVAYAALADGEKSVREAVKIGPRAIETKLIKLDAYLDETAPGTPFREAILTARRTLEAARRGDVAAPEPPPALPSPIARGKWPETGQVAPNIRLGAKQLTDQKGKPAVLIFLKPGSETTELSLAIANALDKRYGGEVLVLPLVMFGETSAAIKDRNRLNFNVPLYDGTAAATTYGVDTVPRFAVIDSEGKIKWTFTGVGSETGFLVKEQVDRLAHPVLPGGPSGITAAPGTVTVPVIPRP
jgi:hypothetical protein